MTPIPVMLAEAVEDTPWSILVPAWKTRAGDTWVTLWHSGSNTTVDVKYTRWRHTRARAYRGSALRAVLTGQAQLVRFLEGP